MLRQKRISCQREFRDLCETFLTSLVSLLRKHVTDKPLMELAILVEEELYKKILYECPPDDVNRDTIWNAIKTTSQYANKGDMILQNLSEKASSVNMNDIIDKFQSDGKALLGYLLNDIKFVKDATNYTAPVNKKRALVTNTKKDKAPVKPRVSLSLKLAPPSSKPPDFEQHRQHSPQLGRVSSSVSHDEDYLFDNSMVTEPEEYSSHQFPTDSSSWNVRDVSDVSVDQSAGMGWGDAIKEKERQLEQEYIKTQEREKIARGLKRDRESDMEALLIEAREHQKTEEEKLADLEAQQKADKEADRIRREEEAAISVNLNSGHDALDSFFNAE